MSPLLALVAGALIAFVAIRTARYHTRQYENRLLPARLRDRPSEVARTEGYAAATIASLEAELRAVRGERPKPLYTPGDVYAARRALAPTFGIRMTVKP